MKRFRFTLLVICLLLFWLGYKDLSLRLENPAPEEIPLELLLRQGPPQQWLTITGGYQNLDEAISTSGTLELDALLVPLKRSPNQEQIDLLIETHDRELLTLFSEYHFNLETEQEKEQFRREHADRFTSSRPVTGMLITGLVADNNRSKLEDLARQLGLKVEPGVLFMAEGKEPPNLRGYFYLGAALLGLGKFISMMRRGKKNRSTGSQLAEGKNA